LVAILLNFTATVAAAAQLLLVLYSGDQWLLPAVAGCAWW
jgi:hypothetical protein